LTLENDDFFNDDFFFDQDDQNLLQSYFDRNKGVEQFLHNPATIPKKLLPQTIGVVAQGDNPSILFQSLRAASTDLFGNQQRARKRKRPAYYKPL